MDIKQKLAALNILRNAGRIPSEVGRKAGVLEILGHDELAYKLITVTTHLDYTTQRLSEINKDAPLFGLESEGYETPAEVVKLEDSRKEYDLVRCRIETRIREIADQMEAEIDAEAPSAVAVYQEGRMIA